jgi:hypothetical protein
MEPQSNARVDDKEIIEDEYLPRLFAPATAHWLYHQCSPLSTRKKPPPEDSGIYGELPRTEWTD